MERLRTCGAARRRSALKKLAHGRAVPGVWPVRVAPGPAGKLEFVPERAPERAGLRIIACGGADKGSLNRSSAARLRAPEWMSAGGSDRMGIRKGRTGFRGGRLSADRSEP